VPGLHAGGLNMSPSIMLPKTQDSEDSNRKPVPARVTRPPPSPGTADGNTEKIIGVS
jgi:hypothetical protein